MKESVIIVAGGKGARMNSEFPKQFIEIGGIPILMRTIERFFKYSSDINIIVVLPENEIAFWKELCEERKFNISHKLAIGGEKRQDSVLNGINTLSGPEGVVAIHDGVRPFVSIEIIRESFKTAKKLGNAVTVVPLKDSIRYYKDGENKALSRENYLIVQTPQTFDLNQIRQAYATCKGEFTDDASLVESAGFKINLVKGTYDNVKITTPDDLIFAEAIIKRNK